MSTEHILKPFDRNLQAVHEQVTGMARMTHQELVDCCTAFADRDKEEASDAIAADDLINATERIIDDLVVKTIVLHQPMAKDCRELIAALRISRDLERIGDYATNIANHSSTLDDLEATGEEQAILDMSLAVLSMMETMINAYDEGDAQTASKVRELDEQIDGMYTDIFSRLIDISSRQSQLTAACMHLTIIARSLERIGDHITDIAEEIIFVKTGVFPEGDRIKSDGTAYVKG